jgi:PAS domain-containing protein
VVDIEGRVIAWNKAAEAVTGIKAKDILGKGEYEYAVPFYGYKRPLLVDLVLAPNSQMEKAYINLERKGKVLIGESFCPMVRGSGAYIRATAVPLFDSSGSIVGAIESMREDAGTKNEGLDTPWS